MKKQHFLCIVFTCLATVAIAQQYATDNMLNKYEFLANNIYGIARSGDNYYFAGSFTEGFAVPNANNIVRFNVKTNTFSKVGPSLNDDVLEIAGTAHGFVARGIFGNVGGDESVSEIAYYNEATNTMTGLPGKKGVGFRFKKDDPYRTLGIGTDVYLFSVLENLHIDREAGEVREGHMIMRLDGSKPELPQSLTVPTATVVFVTGKDHLDRTTYAIKDGHRIFGLGHNATKDTLFVIGEFSVRERNPEYHKAAPPAEQPAAAPAEKPKKKGGLLGKLAGSGESSEGSSNKATGTKKQKYDGNPIMADVLGYDLKNNVWFSIIPSLAEKTTVADHPEIPNVEMVEHNKFFAKHGGAYNGEVRSIVKIGGTYYFGGTFSQWGGDASGRCVISWNGTAFNTMDEGLNGEVHRLFGANGTLYAFGTFTESGTKTKLPKLAMWDAATKKWMPVGALTRKFKMDSGSWDMVGGVKKPSIIERDAEVRTANLVGDDLLVSGYFSFKDANGKLIVNFARFDTKAKKWYAVIPNPPAKAN